MKRNHYIMAVKVAVTLAAFGAIAYRVDAQNVLSAVSRFPMTGVPVLAVLLAAGLATSAIKWQVILKGLGRSVVLTSLLRLSWVGLFFNTFLPGRTGGDVVRAWSLASSDDNRLRSFASVVVDRGLNLLALVLIGSLATFVDPRIPEELALVVRLLSAASFLGAGGFYLLRRRLMRYFPYKLQELLRTLDTGSWNSRRVVTVVALAIAFQTLMVVINIVAARGLQIPVTSSALYVAIPLTAIEEC